MSDGRGQLLDSYLPLVRLSSEAVVVVALWGKDSSKTQVKLK
jgi:hypothetical protein